MSKGNVYVIAAASGTGKTSLSEALAAKVDQVKLAVSYTTRPIRSGEIAGQHYCYVSRHQFEQLIEQGKLLEYAEVFGNYYGTSKELVTEYLAAGLDVILNIDWQGARQVKANLACKTIFLLPPSIQELRRRLEVRDKTVEQFITARMKTASSEILHSQEFDYIVVNDDFDRALLELETIIRAGRLTADRRLVECRELLEGLLSD